MNTMMRFFFEETLLLKTIIIGKWSIYYVLWAFPGASFRLQMSYDTYRFVLPVPTQIVPRCGARVCDRCGSFQ